MSGLMLELINNDIWMEIRPEKHVQGMVVIFTKHSRNIAYSINTILLTGSEIDVSYILRQYLHKFIDELAKDETNK